MTRNLPFLDLTAPGFSTRGTEVLAARDQSWCARTPFGLAVLRHGEAGQILRDRRFRQGSHAWPDTQNLTGSFAEFWKRSIISREGPEHKAQRAIAMAALSQDFILSLVPEFERIARDLAAAYPPEGGDFVAAFSEPFAGHAIAALLGLPGEAAAEIAHDASRLGLAMGVGSKQHEPVFNAACDRLMDLADRLLSLADSDTSAQGFAARLSRAAEAQGIKDRQVLRDLIVISIFGGVDTTRAQLAFAMGLFADHPAQWQQLRAQPQHITNAIEEIIRLHPTTTWATREAVTDVTMGEVSIKAGDTVHLLVHASGTDPAIASADFDVTRRQKMHFGFGGGAHHCLGQFVARTDMAAALRVMAAHWSRIDWAGTPRYLPDSGNTSPVALPIRGVR